MGDTEMEDSKVEIEEKVEEEKKPAKKEKKKKAAPADVSRVSIRDRMRLAK